MSRENLETLERAVVAASLASTWEHAVQEWEVISLEEDPAGLGICVCGHPDLVKLFTIENRINGELLHPIGSVCVNHFGVEELNRDVTLLGGLLALRSALQQGKPVTLTSEYFTRAMLHDLYEQGALPPDQYNDGRSEVDYEFLLAMFNKRHKDTLSSKQRWKVTRLLKDKLFPFILNDPRLK